MKLSQCAPKTSVLTFQKKTLDMLGVVTHAHLYQVLVMLGKKHLFCFIADLSI